MSLITVSPSMGCGSSSIVRLVADELDLKPYDNQRFQQEAMTMGIQSEDLEYLDEKAGGFFDRLWSRKPELSLDLMGSVVYELARRGNGVILGHCSQMFLREFDFVLHVLICASESCRMKHLMEQHGLSRDAAQKLIRKNDHERNSFFCCTYKMDYNDPSLYDLVINTEKVGKEGAAQIIIETARSEKFQTCSKNALEAMERRSLRKKIKAELFKNNFKTCTLQLKVPQKGVVLISGWTKTKATSERLVRVLNNIPGVAEVLFDISVGCWAPEIFREEIKLTPRH